MTQRIVPATGWDCLLTWYDPLVRYFTREHIFKEHLIETAAIPEIPRILDVGCGSGTLALLIAKRFPDSQIVGYDADPRILVQAKRKDRGRRVTWIVGRSTSLPFATSSFDGVFCTLLLHHLTPAETLQTLQEMRRILRPSGRVYVADYGRPASLLARLQFLPVRIMDGWQQTQCNVAGSIPGLLEDAGFTNVCETLVLASILGTIRCLAATPKPAA